MKRVTILSRQSNEPSLDIKMLTRALEETGLFEVKVMCKKLSGNHVSYAFHMLSQLKAIRQSDVLIVDGYCIVNSLFKHKKNLKVIQMWHALSAIKQFGWQTVGKQDGSSEFVAKTMKMHRGYDYVISPSDVTSEHFAQGFNESKEKIVKLGLPRIDYILNGDEEKRAEIAIKYPTLCSGGKKIMLYVPTFRKGRTVNISSLAKAANSKGFALVVKLHPLDGTENPELENVIIDRDYNSYTWLAVADVIVSDYSSFVVEASLVGKPIYLYTYDKDEYIHGTGLNVDYANESIGKYEFEDAEALVDEVVNGNYDYEALEAFRRKYVDIDTNDCTGQFVRFIEEISTKDYGNC